MYKLLALWGDVIWLWKLEWPSIVKWGSPKLNPAWLRIHPLPPNSVKVHWGNGPLEPILKFFLWLPTLWYEHQTLDICNEMQYSVALIDLIFAAGKKEIEPPTFPFEVCLTSPPLLSSPLLSVWFLSLLWCDATFVVFHAINDSSPSQRQIYLRVLHEMTRLHEKGGLNSVF